MNFLDVPASSTASSSLLMSEEAKLAAQRPPQMDPSIQFPGQADGKLKSQVITPLPSFLLKSYLSAPSKIFIPSLSTSEDFPARLKIFINVCHHPNVPSAPPPPPGDGKSVDPWIPGSVGDVSVTVDKAGSPSLVIDVILATSVHDKLKKDLPYKELVIGIALEKVEEKIAAELSRDISLPKTLSSKGPLLPRSVVLPSLPSATNTSTSVPMASSKIQMLPSSTPASPAASSLKPIPCTSQLSLSPASSPSTFTLTLPFGPTFPKPTPKSSPPSLELIEPRTIVLSLNGWEPKGVELVRGLSGGRGEVQEVLVDGLEAEWLVEKRQLVVTGHYR